MAFLGRVPGQLALRPVLKQTITPDGSASFTLDSEVSQNALDVFVNNVRQEPGVAYTVSGTTITFTEAPAVGSSVYIVYQKSVLGAEVLPGPDTLTTAMIKDGAITAAKLATSVDTHDSAAVQAQIDSAAVTLTGNQTITGAKTFTGTTSTPAITLSTTDNTSSAAPILDFVRNTDQANSSDYLGQLKFKGEDSSGGSEVYAKITGKIADPTNGTEDGLLEYAVVSGGSNHILARMTGNGGGKFILENSTNLEVTGDGQVDGSFGIGTASPASLLEIEGTDPIITLDDTSAGGYAQVQSLNGSLILMADEGASVNNSIVRFDVDGTERMRINSSGDISVGSASNHSGARIVINDTPPTAFGSPMFQVGQETFTASGYYSIGLGYTAGSYTDPPAEIAAVATSSSGGTTADIVFGTRSVTTNTAATERMRIASSGNVGIGEDDPGGLLHLKSDDNGIIFQSSSSSNSRAQIFFQNNVGTTTGKIAVDPDGGNANVMAFSTGSTERMRIDNSGLVGIGVTSGLAAKLTVNGSTSVNTLTLGARNPTAGYNHISETGSGVMGIWGHNATAHPTTNNAVKNTVTGWYSHFMRMYYSDGISFHTSPSTIGTDDTTVWDYGSQGSATSKERLRITVGGEVQIWGDGGSTSNRLKLSYNSTSGVATVGPHSTGGSTSLDIGTANSGTYATRMQITNDGRVKAANSYKFNLVTVVSYDNSTQNTVQTAMNNQVFLISIHHSAGVSAILCLPNGGSGVAYDFQMSDPDSGTFTNTNSVSFTMAGTGGNSFTASILGGSGNVTVQRTAGSGSYTVYINQILGGLV